MPIEIDSEINKRLILEVTANADLFFAIDIEERSLEVPQINLAINFELEDSVKERFLKGLDDIGITLDHSEAIKNFENTRGEWLPSQSK